MGRAAWQGLVFTCGSYSVLWPLCLAIFPAPQQTLKGVQKLAPDPALFVWAGWLTGEPTGFSPRLDWIFHTATLRRYLKG